ncbi:coiled-coil domain-containing protein 7 [Trichechus inunguis]
MKRVKRLSSISNKLAFVSELDNKKRQFISSVSPNPKEKHNVKSVQDKIEPMVLRSPPTGESVVRYALPIPSIKTRQLIAEDEIIRKAAKHLSMVVSSLEETYGVDPKPGKKSVTKTDSEELSLSIGDDLNSLLVYCSQYAAQLEEAVKEGRNILESLFKWFQHQVNQIEELSTDQTYSEEDLPVPDKTVSAGIAEVIKQMQKLEELRDQLKHGSKYSLKTMLSKPTAINDQGLLEAKYNKMHSDFQLLSEEKSVLENELQKLKNPEKTKPTSDRTKNTPVKSEKKKDKGKSEESEEKKSIAKQPKTKDLLEVQNTANALEIENKVLQEQLKQALQEAEKTKHQLDYLLNQRKELLKSEQTKTAMQMDISEVKVKDLDSETVPLEKERRKTRLSDSGEHKSNDRIQQHPQIPLLQRGSLIEKSSEKKTSSPAISDLSQILKSQHQSAFLKHSSEASFSGEPSHEPLSETHDKPFTIASSSKEGQDSSSVGMSPEGNETQCRSTNCNSTHLLGAGSSQPDPEELTDQLQQILHLQRSHAQAEETHENTMLKNQDSVSKTQIEVKKQRKFRDGKLNTHDEVPDENFMLEHQDSVSKTQMQVKQQRTPRGKVHMHFHSYDEGSDENLMLENQDSVSETQIQVKKQRNSRGEKHSTHDEVPDENLMLENQDSVSKTQIQVKKQRTSKGGKHSTLDEVPVENLMLENQDSVSDTQIRVEKQITSREEKLYTPDEVPDENLFLEKQDSVSKTQMQVNKQSTSREEKLKCKNNNY